jgi:Ca2+-binding EF-hand superfamily protein
LDDVKVELETEMEALEQEEKQEIQQDEDNVVDGIAQGVDKEQDPFYDLIVELFGSMDEAGIGFMSVNSFRTVLNSRALDLQLSDDELQFMISQASQTSDGLIAYQEVLFIMKDMLIEIFKERAEAGMEERESSWKLFYSPSSGYIYFHKETGEVTQKRPSEYIPPFRDEFFWETMFDIFDTADINRDGVLDREEFFLLLQSQNVGLRLFEEQRTQLLELFDSMGVAAVSFEDFIPLARIIIMLVYQSLYDSKTPWVELNSPQYGPFWYNRFTGEVLLNPPGDVNDEAVQEVAAEEQLFASQPAVLPVPPQDSSRSAKSSITRSLAGTLPPIEEVTDRDTLHGSPEPVTFINRSPSLDIVRPQSPLPPESTPEIDNRKRAISYKDIPDSHENAAVLRESKGGKEKRRHRSRRSKRSLSTESEPREERSHGHSRRRRHKQREKPVEGKPDELQTTEQAQDKSKTLQVTSLASVPVQENKQDAVEDIDRIYAEPLESGPTSTLVEASEETREDKPDEDMTKSTEVEKIGQDVKQDSQEVNPPCSSHPTDEDIKTANSESTKLSKAIPFEDTVPQSLAGDETAAFIKSSMLETSTLSVQAVDQVEERVTKVIGHTNSDSVVNKLDIADADDQQHPIDTEPDSTHALQTNSESVVNKPNLADDDKISLGIASNSSLPKPSMSRVGSARSRVGSASRCRVGSASTSKATVGQVSPTSSAQHSSEALLKQSPAASLHGLKSQSQASRAKISQDGGNGAVSMEDQPLTDQEKLASRRSSLN